MSPLAGGGPNVEWRLRLFLARASAFLIDLLVTVAILGASQLVLWRTGIGPVGGFWPAPAVHAWVTATATLPAYLYFVVTTRLFGATFGKSLLKLTVTRAQSESRPALAAVLLRYLLVIAPFELNHAAMIHGAWWAFIAVYLLVGLLGASMLFHHEGRGLHDRIAGTRVVRRHAAG